jgi:uncharacterized membrane protein
MARKRPVGVLVVGIINMVLGGINVLRYLTCCACGGGGFLIFRSALQSMPAKDKAVFDELWPIADTIPGLVPALIAWVIVGVIATVLQVSGAWGCIRIKQWGRWTSVIWGGLSVVAGIISLIYMLAVFYPAWQEKTLPQLDSWMDKLEDMQRRQGQPVQPHARVSGGGVTGNVFLDNIVSILIELVQLGYAAFVLIFMALPATARAIDRYNRPDDEAEAPHREPGEYYDDDYERQRRSEPPPEPPPLPSSEPDRPS